MCSKRRSYQRCTLMPCCCRRCQRPSLLIPSPHPHKADRRAGHVSHSTRGNSSSQGQQLEVTACLCVCPVSSCFLMTCWQCSAVFLSPDDGSLTDSHCHSISTAGLCQLWDHATQQPINCFELNASANQHVRLSWVTFNRANRVWGLLFSDVVLLVVYVWFNRRTLTF